MTGARDPQLLKGVLPMLTLAVLARGESYGYQLVTVLRGAGLEDLSTGTLYPVLARLEREDLLTSHLVASPSGPARRYYRASAAGLRTLADRRRAWSDLVGTVTRVLDTPPADTTTAPPPAGAGPSRPAEDPS